MNCDYSENILVRESTRSIIRDELGWELRFAHNYKIYGYLLPKLMSGELEV